MPGPNPALRDLKPPSSRCTRPRVKHSWNTPRQRPRAPQAYALAPACFTDQPLTPEEAQLMRQLAQLKADDHPDAAAARLRVAAAAGHAKLPWSVKVRPTDPIRARQPRLRDAVTM